MLVFALICAGPANAAGGADFVQPPTSPEAGGFDANHVASGNFDATPTPDLAVPNSASDTVTVILGDGTGNFTAAPTSPEGVGTQPSEVAVGDFNANGHQDLAVANFGSDDVTVLMGDGTGNFTAAATSPEGAGDRPESIVVGRFDAGATQDLAVTNQGTDDVSILLGDGTGNFTPAASSPETGFDGPRAPAVADFDGDTDQDLAVANTGDDVTIMLGDGTGNFAPAATSPEAAGSVPTAVDAGDFDGNGHKDLAVANLFGSTATILMGDGTGNFTPAATSPEATGSESFEVAVGHLNSDLNQDLAVVNHGPFNVTILLGDGTGNFTSPPTSPEAAISHPAAVAIADFDGNGRNDLAVANRFFSPNVTILLADLTPPDPPTLTATDPASPSNSNSPKLTGTLGEGDPVKVKLYMNSTCSSPFAASVSASRFTGTGKRLSVPSDSTTEFSARALDAGENHSGCSNSLSYTEDSTPPEAPTITGTDPASPADETNPKVFGTLGAGDPTRVKLYRRSGCSNFAVGGSAAQFMGAGITLNVPQGSATNISARAFDAAGNRSGCSNSVAYAELP